jgi:Arc/MetJ-type ribon-helix-helix transcriptional regulator
MVIGMATTKVTVTVPEAELAEIKKLVESGQAASVSGFVQHAIGASLQNITGWGAILATALDETGGRLTPEERAWADEVLGNPSTKRQRKRSAA